MLLPAKMSEFYVLVHRRDRDRVIKALHRMGIAEVDLPKELPPEVNVHGVEDEHSRFAELDFRVTKVLEVLEGVAEHPLMRMAQKIKRLVFPPPPVKYPSSEVEREALIREVEETLAKCEHQVLALQRKREEIAESIARARDQIRWLRHMQGWNIELSALGESPYLFITVGTVRDISALVGRLRKTDAIYEYREISEGRRRKKGQELYLVAVLAHIKDKKAVEAALRNSAFSELNFEGLWGTPPEVIKMLQERIKDLQAEAKETLRKLRSFRREFLEKLRVLRDEVHNEKMREEIKVSLLKTEMTTLLHGFVRKKEEHLLRETVERASGGSALVLLEEAKGEDVPVDYENPKPLKPYEMFVDMFSPPKYGKIEPTAIIGPLFVLYFGITLGDAFYGLLVALTGFLLLKGRGKFDDTYRQFGSILFASGLSAVFFGILQGGFMGPMTLESGNPMAIFLYRVLGLPQMPVFLDTMSNPIILLLIALVLGIAQLMLGYAFAAWQNIKDRKYLDLLQDQVSWFLLVPGGGILIGVAFGWWEVSPTMVTIAWIIVAVGLFLLFQIPDIALAIRWGEKGILGRGIGKMLKFFDLTGFIGNWLSYARLLALGLATAGIAMTINIFAGILVSFTSQFVCATLFLVMGVALMGVALRNAGDLKGVALKYVGAFLLVDGILFAAYPAAGLFLFLAVFLIVAHIGNAVLQALGSFVHSLRLQYVEFFGTFYEGGGRRFEPFEEKRIYTERRGVSK